ncbi:somatostatin receptor type 4-like [Haliotis rubra]|uniref:somatostatin receptor type 4-like n=1 Tax=Haliotis rubra TaxID=36100 RepID=UPI001EE56ACF|nr:somatostatin receptor type 4-like [Haliotis rubra]
MPTEATPLPNASTPWASMNNTTHSNDEAHDDIFNEYTGFRVQTWPYVLSIDIIAAIGIVGNILTMVLMTSRTQRRYSYAIYMAFLAVFDSLVLAMVATEDTLDHLHDLLETFLNSHIVVCKLWAFILECSLIISPWLLMSMSVDRYVTVVHPRYTERVCRPLVSIVVSVIICVVAMVLVSPLVHAAEYIPDDETKEGYICGVVNPDLENYYMFLSAIMESLLPVSLLFGFNIHTVVTLCRSTRSVSHIMEANVRKITISIVLVSVLSALALVPFAIVYLIEYILIVSDTDRYLIGLFGSLWHVFNVVRLVNYAMNFYVLIISSNHHRTLLIQKVTCSRNANQTQMEMTKVDGNDTRVDTNISAITEA